MGRARALSKNVHGRARRQMILEGESLRSTVFFGIYNIVLKKYIDKRLANVYNHQIKRASSLAGFLATFPRGRQVCLVSLFARRPCAAKLPADLSAIVRQIFRARLVYQVAHLACPFNTVLS